MNRQDISTTQQDNYVPSSEALELFKPLDKNAFNYRVRKGEISYVKGKRVRDNRYSTEDIKVVKKKLLKQNARKEKKTDIIIDWLKPQDITATMDLDYLLYHEHFIGEAQLYQAWRYKNPHISVAAFDANDRRTCYAYIGLIPLSEKTVLDILSEKRAELSIKPEEIETYDRSGAYTLLANSAAVHPEKPELLYKILYRIMQFWVDQYPEKYIKKIYARSISDKGDLLIQHLFMAPRPDLAHNAYELDLSRSAASKIIRWFKEQLISKAPLPPDLQNPLRRYG